MDDPRVLIISHNALSRTKNNGKTLRSFFSAWDEDALAQLYITPEAPDRTLCRRFFRITDGEILRAALGRCLQPGSVVEEAEDPDAPTAVQTPGGSFGFLRRLISAKPPILSLARDLCWGIGKWKTAALEAWLDDFQPQAVFMQCSAPAIYDIAFWICQRYQIPYFLEITDDYTSSRKTLDPFFWLYLRRMRRQMKKAISLAEKTLVIGEKMEKEYQKRFGGRYYIAMNSVPTGEYTLPQKTDGLNITFTGNLGLGRWETIAKIGEACEKDPLLREKVSIHIYSGTQLEPQQLAQLNRGMLHFHGSVSAQQVAEIQSAADVLLHVESFDEKNRFITRYSISTKISEYLSRGKCVLAVGPEDVASIEYIRDYDLGAVLTDLTQENVISCLHRLLEDGAYREACGRRGHTRAAQYHNIEIVQKDIREMVCGAVQR